MEIGIPESFPKEKLDILSVYEIRSNPCPITNIMKSVGNNAGRASRKFQSYICGMICRCKDTHRHRCI